MVLTNKLIEEIAVKRPKNLLEFANIDGVGPAKLKKYGRTLLNLVQSHELDDNDLNLESISENNRISDATFWASYKDKTKSKKSKKLKPGDAEKANLKRKKRIEMLSDSTRLELKWPEIEFNDLNDEQKEAANYILQGNNIFLTGSAGTGKTFLLRYIIQELEKKYDSIGSIAITAPTGIAAINIGGQTIHSFAGIGIGKFFLFYLLYMYRHTSIYNGYIHNSSIYKHSFKNKCMRQYALYIYEFDCFYTYYLIISILHYLTMGFIVILHYLNMGFIVILHYLNMGFIVILHYLTMGYILLYSIGKGDKTHIINKVLKSNNAVEKWSQCKVLIIDEISMLSYENFELLNEIAQIIKNNKTVYGGIQVILVGDFMQLPPVTTKHTMINSSSNTIDTTTTATTNINNNLRFCFQSPIWEKLNFNNINNIKFLSKVERQKDLKFINFLNLIRKGYNNYNIINLLNQCLVKNKPLPLNGIVPTKLYSTNKEIDYENNKKLLEINEELVILKSEDRWLIKPSKASLNPYFRNALDNIISEEISLKVGAQVMLLRNRNKGQYSSMIANSGSGPSLVNGSRGKVVGFSESVLKPGIVFFLYYYISFFIYQVLYYYINVIYFPYYC